MSLGQPVPESMTIAPPSAPGNNATVTLFDSVTMMGSGKQLRYLNATLLEVTFNSLDQDSAASGLKSYTSTDSGTNWIENLMRDDSGTATMGATISATDDPRTYRFVLSSFEDFRLRYTAGATGPSAWGLSIVLHFGPPAVQR